jgi:hypothetical protein
MWHDGTTDASVATPIPSSAVAFARMSLARMIFVNSGYGLYGGQAGNVLLAFTARMLIALRYGLGCYAIVTFRF